MRIRKASEDGGGTAFADYVWKPVVLIEMKKRGADLSKHYRQAFDYWARLVPDRPQYVVLCNFDEFWVYDFDTQLDSPEGQGQARRAARRAGARSRSSSRPTKPRRSATTAKRSPAKPPTSSPTASRSSSRARSTAPLAQRFILQMLVALFAEDIGLLPQYLFTHCSKTARSPPTATTCSAACSRR